MVKLYSKGGGVPMHFVAPNDGGGSGGSSGQSSNGDGGGDKDPILAVFESLPWDELDDDSRSKLEKARDASVATSQQARKAADDLKTAQELQRRFQGDADRLRAELEKAGLGEKKQQQQQDDPIHSAVKEELLRAGYDADNATKLSPVFASMFKRIGAIQAQELGTALQPMANTVLATQAQDAWQVAVQSDALGMFQEPTVAQRVWDFVKERVAKGEPTTPEIVANLGKMAWADHLMEKHAKGEEVKLPAPGELPKAPPMPGMNTGFTFPGAGNFSPIVRAPADPNAARTILDVDTANALASSFKTMLSGMDIKPPKELQTLMTTKRGGSRR